MKGDIISGTLAVVIVVSSTLLILNTINPFIEEGRDIQSFNEAKQSLEQLDAVIKQLIYEAPGSRRSVDMNIREGRLQVVGSEDSIKIRLENVNLLSTGATVQEGNILITSGENMRAYESDIDGDGNTDLVLENNRLIFAIEKIGNSSSHVAINTSTFITLMRIKNLSLNISNPGSGIFIDDRLTTSYGVGYTELTRAGENLISSGIHVYVNATATTNVTYDATFSLKAGQDFIGFGATHITGV